MALVEHCPLGFIIIAQDGDERGLLEHARRHGGALLIRGSSFRVKGAAVMLPEGTSPVQADGICDAFQAAARSHRRACLRRQRFTLVE